MNARQQNQADTISIYVYALRAKLERLDQTRPSRQTQR